MPEVSVVIPARDVVDYLGACLADLTNQTFGDFEVLVVDDGSTDGTSEIIAAYAERDTRIRPLRLDGAGPSGARNLALEHATGRRLAFVDADDRIVPHYLATMRDSMEATGSTLVAANARRLYGYRTGASGLHQHLFRGTNGGTRLKTHLRNDTRLVYDTTLWNKLIDREAWESVPIRFAPGRWINDIAPCIHIHARAITTDILDDVLYYWRARPQAGTSITDGKLVDPEARAKSLGDRMFALHSAREILSTELAAPGNGAAITAFDHRVLTHDLWAYLALYATDDEQYRQDLVREIQRYVNTFDIDVDQFDVGILLEAVYPAVAANDHARLDALLAPQTKLRAVARNGRVGATLATHSPQADASIASPDVGNAPITAHARIHAVEVTDGPSVTLRGSVRFRQARANVGGDWRLSAAIQIGRRVATGPQTTLITAARDEHPMLADGWHPFAVTLDAETLAAMQPSGVIARGTVGVGMTGRLPDLVARFVREHRISVHARVGESDVTLDVDAPADWVSIRSLGTGARAIDGTDVFAVALANRTLALRRVAAPVHVISAAAAASDVELEFVPSRGSKYLAQSIELRRHTTRLANLPGIGGLSRILQLCTRGRRIAPFTPATADRALDATAATGKTPTRSTVHLPQALLTPGTSFWWRNARKRERLRVQQLDGPLPLGGGRFLASDRYGFLTVVRQPDAPTLRSVAVDGDLLVLEGTLGASSLTELVAQCRWSDDRVTAQLDSDGPTWAARIPVPGGHGSAGPEDLPRAWDLLAIASDDARLRLLVNAELQTQCRETIEIGDRLLRLEIARGDAARIWVHDRAADSIDQPVSTH